MPTDRIKTSRSFVWLNVTQFLGALNDNVFKLLVIFLLIDLLGDDQRAKIVASASVIFVVPFLLFSHAAGLLADRVSKRSIIVFAKWLECAVMFAGCVAIYFCSPYALYGIIFLMSAQSALFGPSKYGVIPELVEDSQLSRANSQLVGLTYLAIIIGTFIPSYLLLNVLDRNFLGLGMFCVGVAAIGILASRQIRKTPPAGSEKQFSPFFLAEIFRTLRSVAHDRNLFSAVVGSAYFLFLAAFIQQNTLLYGRDYLDLDWIESGYLFPIAALGIGLGATLAGKLSGRNIEFGVVPLGALGLTASTLALGLVPPVMRNALVVIFLIGFSSGLFIVPLNAFIQYRSPPRQRGEILACVNFLSFLGVALSAGVIVLLHQALGLTADQCFVAAGALTGVLAVAAICVLPDFLVRFVVVLVTRCIYRLTVRGLENIPVDGGAVLVSNHVTYADALFIGATTQRRIRFVMAREVYEIRWLQPLFKLMRAIPISPQSRPREIVASLNEARRALDEGCLVCIFAEGGITRNGNMRGFRPGLERIVKGSDYPIIPTYIGGAWGSIFSYYGGRAFHGRPRRIPYPVSVHFGRPLPATSVTREIRQAVLELSCEAFDLKKEARRTLSHGFVRAARRYWFRPMLADTTGKRLNFGRALAGAVALSGEVRRMGEGQEMIGLLLPSTVGGALANFAVVLSGRVPVNLNFTASRQSVDSAIEQCGIRTVISSRAFIEKLGNFEAPRGTVWLEDIVARISGLCKLLALFKAAFAPTRLIVRRAWRPDDPAAIIFSSGSTGQPKGIVLSHHNIISNIESFTAIFRITPAERMCAVLPFFHSFGFTTTLWAPALVGFSASYHPNPLDGARVSAMIHEMRSTLLLATPTFLLTYIRRGKREEFKSLRAVITGAEKLRERVADAFEKHFGMRPLEGYGTTELSPAAALNIPDVVTGRVGQIGTKQDSIGHPMPGVVMKIVDPDTGNALPEGAEGVLMVKGPNVMLGYLNNPEKTDEVLQDGWYNTGDIAKIDADGFVFILDRVSRFSKIGGEMVPHMAVEDKICGALGIVGRAVVVTSAPDERKGEQLVVCYTDEAGEADEIRRVVKEIDLPNLWKPHKENYARLEEIPSLGSGKLDLKKIRQIALEFVENRPGPIRRAVDAIKKGL